MASKKIKDLAVKTGSYTDRDGATKNRYENIGAIMDGDNGMYVMLKRTFNPAGVDVEPGRDSILVSAFDPKPADGQQAAPQRQQAPARQAAPQSAATDDADIPF